jgi:23S rRNA pseudouridine1911/1915/1917 synthase
VSSLSINNILAPQILAAEKDFIIVYKPPRMHSAPLSRSMEKTILDWCSIEFPEIAELPGRKTGEGGLLHRLDYETHGLMLLAKTISGMETLLNQQRKGKIFKEYSALAAEGKTVLRGFPPGSPRFPDNNSCGVEIISAFRAYGPGRKSVRPVLIDSAKDEKQYNTEILETSTISGEALPRCLSFRLRISRGFRHQIRSHLAWLGWPILNDSLYGGLAYETGLLALRAASISFFDPASGEERSYSIPSLGINEIRKL